MGRSPCSSKDISLRRGAWTPVEDHLLTMYIQQNGEGSWRHLPRKAGLLRCGKSCRFRWINYLRPDIKKGNITQDEEDLIIRLHKLLGNRWAIIAGRLPKRTDNEIKNYWNTHLKKKLLKNGLVGTSYNHQANKTPADRGSNLYQTHGDGGNSSQNQNNLDAKEISRFYTSTSNIVGAPPIHTDHYHSSFMQQEFNTSQVEHCSNIFNIPLRPNSLNSIELAQSGLASSPTSPSAYDMVLQNFLEEKQDLLIKENANNLRDGSSDGDYNTVDHANNFGKVNELKYVESFISSPPNPEFIADIEEEDDDVSFKNCDIWSFCTEFH